MAATVRLRRATLIALACVAILVAAPVARVAFAGVEWGTVDCCCGEHAGDHRCPCPDCPAADHPSGDDAPPDGAPHVEPCGANAQWVSPATMPPFVAPTVAAIRAPVRRVLLLPDPFTAPPDRAVHPETPPS